MFKFNFEVEADTSEDPEAVKSPIFSNEGNFEPESENTKNIDWYQAEKVKPIDNLISTLDFYELNAKEMNSEENHSDLIAGVYEGGAKIWECTESLLLYLSEKQEDSFWKDKRVLDLGCGSGLLGIYAMKHGARVDFQDYNKDVLEYITYPNVLLNVDESLTDDGKLEFLDKHTSLYAGDWAHFTQLTKEVEKYDLILTSETIYNIENQQKLLETFAARKSEVAEAKSAQENRTLCCCEYVAQDSQQRTHILACCCNCVDFDLVFTSMLIAFQDRLRLPWRGGAKRISPAAVAPAFIVPLMLGLATLNSKTAVVLMLTLVGFTVWGVELAKRTATRTNFFLSWLVFSVPLLELAPEENYALMFFSCAALYCLYSTKVLAPLNLVSTQYGTTPKDELPGIAEASSGEEQAEAQITLQMDSVLSLEDDDDEVVTPRRAYHCPICGTCVKRRDHHSYWLNCCIGERNYVWYIVGLALSEIALLLGANLTLTSICHPFMVVRPLGYPVLLPDDCSEVLGISFVVACYALLISAYIAFILTRQAYLWWKGSTLHEFKRASNAAVRNRIWSNWRAILNHLGRLPFGIRLCPPLTSLLVTHTPLGGPLLHVLQESWLEQCLALQPGHLLVIRIAQTADQLQALCLRLGLGIPAADDRFQLLLEVLASFLGLVAELGQLQLHDEPLLALQLEAL
ncbi:hypothetical protein M5D96_003729 [Drosophila gunungcola]|uniref:Palmitoyltransferase n=1 Tax=Drosophila gunungcola TaxID=103775 RepID=A0A9P9YSR9_9MUSC|nr:hypothetical protein M5D96_003729 [Drosophila gunungcola]